MKSDKTLINYIYMYFIIIITCLTHTSKYVSWHPNTHTFIYEQHKLLMKTDGRRLMDHIYSGSRLCPGQRPIRSGTATSWDLYYTQYNSSDGIYCTQHDSSAPRSP